MSVEDRPRRRTLTPIGDELTHREFEVGTPSIRDRWRRRRRLLPTPSTWYGAVLVGIVRFAIVAGIAVGVTFLIGVLGGWTNGTALAKVFYVVGAFMMLGAVLAAASPFGATPYMSQYSRRETQKATPLFLVLGLGLIVIGVLLDSRY